MPPEDLEERNKAIAQFKAIKQEDFVPSSPSNGTQIPATHPFTLPHDPEFSQSHQAGHHAYPRTSGASNTSSAVRGMSVAYASDRQTFWGKIDEGWQTRFSRYQFMCHQNRVTGADKISHMHYLLDGAALQLFINDVEGRITNWGEVVRRFYDRYASAAKQDSISHQLNEVSISQFHTDDVTEAQAFRATVDEIYRLSPMSYPEDRTDRAKMLHLEQAVLGRKWARTVLSNVTANKLKYHTMVERLEYSLQQTTKHQATYIESSAGSSTTLRSSCWKSTNFAGQGLYGREPRSRASIDPRPPPHLQSAQNQNRIHPNKAWSRRRTENPDLTCHNCGNTGCPWYRSTKPLDMKRVAQNRLKTAAGRSGLARANITYVAASLAQDLSEDMETLLVSTDVDEGDLKEESANKTLMTHLEHEACVNHSVHFELPVPSDEDSADLDGDLDCDLDDDLDLPEDFKAGLDLPTSPETQAKSAPRQDRTYAPQWPQILRPSDVRWSNVYRSTDTESSISRSSRQSSTEGQCQSRITYS